MGREEEAYSSFIHQQSKNSVFLLYRKQKMKSIYSAYKKSLDTYSKKDLKNMSLH